MIKTYKEALEKIFTIEETRDYSLERVVKAMELLNNPLKNIKVIHVAGTNGKGSVCRMVYSALKEAGYKVGTYNQPHLVDIRERFLASDSMITEDEFIEILNRVLDLPLEFSYFEKTTLIAFLFFEKRRLDYACVEVGFGGLLDSTNVVNPFITAITSIGYDHMNFLGNTLEEISYHKAGIIKAGIPIVYNHENKVIEEIAKEKNAPIIFTTKEFETNLKGKYQKRNAGIAYEICKYIFKNNPPLDKGELEGVNEIILAGLQKVNHPGRLQSISKNLIIDGAHNIDGLKVLKEYTKKNLVNKYKDIYYCFSLKHGKTPENIVNTFGEDKNYILVSSKHQILENEKNIEDYLKEKGVNYKKLTPEKIIKKSEIEKDNLFLIFGSLYMIGEFIR